MAKPKAPKNAPKNSAPAAGSAVRVLRDIVVDGIQYLCDQVVSFPENVLAGLQQNGSVDAHPDAVQHCIDVLEKEIIEHIVEPIMEAVDDALDPDDSDDDQSENAA